VTTQTTSVDTMAAATSIHDLESRLVGELLRPGDETYDDVRQVQIRTFDARPAIIVRAAYPGDVVEAVRFARAHHWPLAVRSGGHSLGGFSAVDGTITIDLSLMKKVTVDPQRGTARVQAGANSGDIAGPAEAYGFALSTGDTSSVGVGGLTTGGGIGWMARKYGLAIDNLRAVEMVTAEGRLIRASATQHADLFWAVRGGGGNFGIITEFEFQLAPAGSIYGGAIVLPATREVIRGYLDYTPVAPEGLTTIAFMMAAPPAPFIPEELVGQLVVLVGVCFVGDPEEGERALAPLRALAEPLAEAVGAMPYPAMFALTEEASKPHRVSLRSMFSDELPDDAIDAMISSATNATSPMSMVQLRGLGGALAKVPADATAFAHRERKYLVAVIGLWVDETDDGVAHRRWTQELWEELKQYADGVYVNFLEQEGDARIREAYPAGTYDRLVDVKRRYDPENVFRFNQNIKPAA